MKLDLNKPLLELKALYLKAKDSYYEDSIKILTDDQFDDLEDYIKGKTPSWSGLKKTGAPVKTKNKKEKVKLPIACPSLDKVKDITVQAWLDKQHEDTDVTISDKLDGSAIELEFVKGKPVFCATRGDGVIGKDISFLIPHLLIPQKVGTASFTIRCEGIFSSSAFAKYKNEFTEARNGASGVLNTSGEPHAAIKDLHIVVLQVMAPNGLPSKGLAWAKSKGFTVVRWSKTTIGELDPEVLTTLLAARRSSSKYEMDGIVITLDKVNKQPTDASKPKWAVAYKSNVSIENAPVTTITSVEWEISAHGLLKPVAIYDPIKWGGSTLTKASAYNAAFVNSQGIGKGAKVAVLRSGEIIPKIVKVLKKARPSIPDVKIFGSYSLNKNKVEYVLDAPLANEDFRIKKISRFFVNIGVDFLREKTVRKLYASGFTNVKSLTKAQPKDFMKIPGVKETTANKLFNSIHKVLDAGIPLVTLMDASGVFPYGMGTTRFESIQAKCNLLDLCEQPESQQLETLVQIPGFKDTTAKMFIKGSKKFLKWMSIVGIQPTQPKKVKVRLDSSKLKNLSITFTGYRDKDQEDTVVKNGGTVVPFGAKTSVLLVSPNGKASTKEDKAEQKGIPVLTWDKFCKKYKLI